MGKLHTLRRAIKRNPERWLTSYGSPKGARFLKQTRSWQYWLKDTFTGPGWYPSEAIYSQDAHSYKNFVRSVLLELGYTQAHKKSRWSRAHYVLRPPTQQEKQELVKGAELALEERMSLKRKPEHIIGEWSGR